MWKLEAGNYEMDHDDRRWCKSISVSVSKIAYAGKTLLIKIKTDSAVRQ